MNAIHRLPVRTQRLSTIAGTLLLFLPFACVGASGVIDQYNNVSINIPDNTGASVSAQVATAGAPANAIITSVNIYSEVLHTYRGDLQIWATAYYNGGWHDHFLLNRPFNGSGNDSSDNFVGWVNNIHTWDGASPNQTWYLSVKDLASGDTGKLEFFQIQVSWVNSANISVDVRTSSGSRLSAGEMNAVILFNSGGTENDRKTNPSANPMTFSDKLFGSYFVDVYCWDMLTKRYNFTHNSTSTSIAPQQDTQKRTLKVTAYYTGGTIPYSGASVYLDSWNGQTSQWTQRASGTTGSDGSYSFSGWPTTISGEKYRIRVNNTGGTQVAVKSDATLANTSSGSSYSLTTSQAPLTGTISADVRDSANAVLAVAEMNAVILFDRRLPDGGNEVQRKQPPTANSVQFTGVLYGPSYFADVYCWDMLAGRSGDFAHMSPTTTVTAQTNPKRPLTVAVLYTDGISKFPGATVSLDSYNGQFTTWQNRANGVADANGNVVFNAWPTTVSGEKYRLRVIWGGNQVGFLEPVTLANISAGSSYSITTSVKLAEIVGFTPPSTGQRARGTQLQTTVQVRNNSTSARSFWVGLSFAHESATNATWPIGFYDIQPIQTPTIQPGQTNTVTFTFAPHQNLRPGQYFARASTWPGFDSAQYKMVAPRLDDTLNPPNTTHPEWTTSRPERIGLASFSLGPYESTTDTVIDQLRNIARDIYFKGADLRNQYVSGQKPLFYFTAEAGGNFHGVDFTASGSFLIDLADLLEITPEGQEGWVTIWIDASGSLGVGLSEGGASGLSTDSGVMAHDFSYTERAEADNRRNLNANLGLAVPGIYLTFVEWDSSSGWQWPKLEWSGEVQAGLFVKGTAAGLVSREVKVLALKQAFSRAETRFKASAVKNLKVFTGLLREEIVQGIMDIDVRPTTFDDGSWQVISHQREVPLTLNRAWTESEKTAHYFYIDVPAKTTDLTIQTTGGTGNADVYVRYGNRPTSRNPGGYDTNSANAGNTESVSISSPQAGRWFMMLPTTTSYANIELLARVTTDTNAPTVSITSPASGTTYTNALSIPISANATDNVAVVRVEFFDGAALKSTDTTAPYSNYWAFTSADNGAHAWTARAYDAAGNVSTSSVVTLTVSIDATSPTVAITSPANGATVTTSTTTVSGTASDPGSPASGLNVVQVRVNGGSWSNATGTTSWSRSVTLSPCSNTIEARSLDKAGNVSSTNSISVTYSAPNTAPSTPVNVAPAAGVLNVSITPTLQASIFADSDCLGDTHGASHWQVLNSGGTAIVADSGTNTASLTSWLVPTNKLYYGSNYQWRVRYRDSRNGWSSNSMLTTFTTAGPQLNGAKLGTNMVFKWPTNALGFALQWSTNPASVNWSNATPAPVIVSGQYTVTNNMTNAFRFYRLKK